MNTVTHLIVTTNAFTIEDVANILPHCAVITPLADTVVAPAAVTGRARTYKVNLIELKVPMSFVYVQHRLMPSSVATPLAPAAYMEILNEGAEFGATVPPPPSV